MRSGISPPAARAGGIRHCGTRREKSYATATIGGTTRGRTGIGAAASGVRGGGAPLKQVSLVRFVFARAFETAV